MDIAFQDQIVGNHCWGCSPTNESGLHIKSFWSGDESVCTWNPGGHHAAAEWRHHREHHRLPLYIPHLLALLWGGGARHRGARRGTGSNRVARASLTTPGCGSTVSGDQPPFRLASFCAENRAMQPRRLPLGSYLAKVPAYAYNGAVPRGAWVIPERHGSLGVLRTGHTLNT